MSEALSHAMPESPERLSGPADAPVVSVAGPVDAARSIEDGREDLATRYGHMAFALALHLTGRREDALDIAQESMLRFYRHVATLRNQEDPRPWLLTTVRNLTRDLWRRRRVRPTDSIDEGALVTELRAPGDSPQDVLERRERQKRVWRAIEALPIEKREILVLRDFQDLSYADIARVLAIPSGTVMSRLHAARAALRVALGKEESRA